jgi:phosphoribosylformylglycinamidine (FGAM) synthase-like enzyme
VISAFARVEDVRHTVTPQLSTEDNALLLIDLGKGTTRWARRRWRRSIASSATSRLTCAMSR